MLNKSFGFQKLLLPVLMGCAIFTKAQVVDQQTEIIYIDSSYNALNSHVFIERRPNDKRLIIYDDDFVYDLTNDFEYWDEFFGSSFKKTLIVYTGINNRNNSDSILTIQNSLDKYSFSKTGDKWLIRDLEINDHNTSLRNIAVGTTSKQFFKILKKKNKNTVLEGKIWVMSQDKKKHFEFIFSEGKVIRMSY